MDRGRKLGSSVGSRRVGGESRGGKCEVFWFNGVLLLGHCNTCNDVHELHGTVTLEPV